MPHSKYVTVTRWAMGIVSFVFVVVLVFLYPQIEALAKGHSLSQQAIAFFVVTFGGIYSGIFGLIMWAYEKWGWRWHSTEHDYNGYWHMKISYDFCERQVVGAERLNLPYHFESVFKVKQDPFDLKFAEGFSAKNEVWRDQSLRLTETGFNMSYEVNRLDKEAKDALPSRAIGFEIVEVVRRNSRNRPEEMIGRMSHAALPDTNLYRGATHYKRLTKYEYTRLLAKMKSGEYKTAYHGEQDV